QSAQSINSPGIPLELWTKIIKAVDKKRPRAIVFDQVFALPYSINKPENFVTDLGGVKTPLYAGAFLSKSPIRSGESRVDLLTQMRDYSLSHLLSEKAEYSEFDYPVSLPFAYGPDKRVID